MIALMAVFLLAATAASLLAPSADAADEQTGMFTDIRAESYVAGTTSATNKLTYTIYAVDNTGTRVSYVAKLVDQNGNSAGGSVSPSSGSTVAAGGTILTVTAPSTPGNYVLVVEFTFTRTDEKVTKTAPVKAVTPITLSAVVDNSNGDLIVGMEVWFVVDGKTDDRLGEQTIDVAKGGTKTVTFDWVTENLRNGEHTVMLMGQVGPNPQDVPGLNEEVKFFVGQKSYAMVETILIIMLIVMLIVLFIVFRKPVKNFGKPKGRR